MAVAAFEPKPVTLESDHVILRPMRADDAPHFAAIGLDESIWRYMPFRPTGTESFEKWVAAALEEMAAGRAVAFTIVDKATESVAGSTRYFDFHGGSRGLEIGWTWLAPKFQRTAVNTHCKYLLLRHAFESLGANRVQLKTDGRNEKSKTAIQRIGAKYEGILRKHMLLPDGHIRDTAFFSVIAEEWPEVKRALEAKVGSACA